MGFHSALYLSSRADQPACKQQHEELVKTANLLFGTLEQCYIWSHAGRLLDKSCHEKDGGERDRVQPVGAGPCHFEETCRLVSFLLDMLSTDSSADTQAQHLPSLLFRTADLLRETYGLVGANLTAAGIDLCLCLLKKIQPAHETEEWAGSLRTPTELQSLAEDAHQVCMRLSPVFSRLRRSSRMQHAPIQSNSIDFRAIFKTSISVSDNVGGIPR